MPTCDFRLLPTRSCSILALSSLLVMLSACSSEPSSSDVDKVVRSSVEQAARQLGGFGGFDKVKVHDVQKLGCKSEGSGAAFVCDVEVDSTTAAGLRAKRVSQLRLIKGSDGCTTTR